MYRQISQIRQVQLFNIGLVSRCCYLRNWYVSRLAIKKCPSIQFVEGIAINLIEKTNNREFIVKKMNICID